MIDMGHENRLLYTWIPLLITTILVSMPYPTLAQQDVVETGSFDVDAFV